MSGRKSLPNQTKSPVRARMATNQAVDFSEIEAELTDLDTRVTTAEADIVALEAVDVAYDTRLDALEAVDVAYDTRLDALEAFDLTLQDLAFLDTVNNAQWSGTDLAIVNGGTGASDAATARTNLGLAIGTNVQAYDAGLQSIADLTTLADRMIYTTASDVYAVTPLTSFARTLLDDADAATMRTTLGLVIGTNVQAQNAALQSIAGLTTLADRSIYTTASNTYAVYTLTAAGRALLDDADAAAQRTTLGLGTAATVNTGTSGATIPLLSTANTWSDAQTFSSTAPTLVWAESDTSTLGRIQLTGGDLYIQAGAAGAGSSGSGDLYFSGWSSTDIGTFQVRHSGAWQNIWHAGNDGPASGLDADTLDGVQPSAFALTILDDADAATARTTLGLGTAATQNTGTSGANVPLLNGTNTWAGVNTFAGVIVPTDNALPQGNVKLGRSTTQYVDFHGAAAGHYITAVSPAGAAEKHDIYLAVSVDAGATQERIWRFRGSDGSLTDATGGRTFWNSGNDGAGSGLDADLLDGVDSGSFLRSDATDSASGALTFSGGLTLSSGPGTIAGTTFDNGWLRVGTSSLGWTWDNNEMYTAGACLIGSLAGSTMSFINIPAFNGGTSGSTAPFTVDSNFKVSNLNADLLDGYDVGSSGSAIPLLSGTNTWSGSQTITNGTGAAVITAAGDFRANRGDGTGAIYLNNALDRYLYYNGTSYELNGANLTINGSQAVTLSGTQTLTNKTLTSPGINGATLSGTLSGNHTKSGVITFTAANAHIFNTAAATQRLDLYQSGGSNRWAVGVDNGAESGSNAGSNFVFYNYTDAGAFVTTVLNLNRSTGNAQFANCVRVAATTAGTAAAPSFSFATDTDTGMYRVTNDVIGFATAGTLRFSASTYFYGAASGSASVASAAGTASLPSYTFVGDENTGFYSGGADIMSLSVGGTNRWNWNTAAMYSGAGNGAAAILSSVGTASTPTYYFAGDNNTGLYWIGADNIGVSLGGTKYLDLSTTLTESIAPLKARIAASTETTGTLTATSANRTIQLTGNITIDNSVFSAGDIIVVYAGAASRTITQGTGVTMRLDATATTGTRTLAAYGMATLFFVSASEVIVAGKGVT